MQYYNSIKDENGFIHSIDNVVFVYYIKSYNMDKVADELIAIRKNNACDGWEKLNCPACSKYSWYQNVVHIGSIHISFGKMQSFDKVVSRTWTILPMLRIEVNPNKHYNEKVFIDILDWIRKNCSSGELKKYDYAIDVPYKISNVKVYNSRKEAGLYKGTIYRGQRSQHGFMKIYDKAKEDNNESVLTRIEHTLEYRKPLSLEKISIINMQSKTADSQELDNLNRCIVTLCLALQAHDVDFEPYIASLNYRRRKTIEPYLYGNGIELIYDESVVNSLLDKIIKLFDADSEILLGSNDESNLDNFIEISDLEELPFD